MFQLPEPSGLSGEINGFLDGLDGCLLLFITYIIFGILRLCEIPYSDFLTSLWVSVGFIVSIFCPIVKNVYFEISPFYCFGRCYHRYINVTGSLLAEM